MNESEDGRELRFPMSDKRSDRQGLETAGPKEGMFGLEDEQFWEMYESGAFSGDPTAYGND